MIPKSEQIRIHYELAMSIGTSLDLKRMLRHSLTAMLKKMNCPAGGVHFAKVSEEGRAEFEEIITILQDNGAR